MDLPVTDMLNEDKKVPKGKKGTIKLESLNEDEIFQVIYQIRNNLFHGSKNPEKNSRDKELAEAACEFMIPFLIDLIENTYGEVKNACETF